MRKEQITVTNNSVCNSAENKGLEGKGMKRRLLHFKKRMVPAVSGALMGVMLMSTKFCKALFIKKYPSSLSDRFINEITSLPVHSITSIDVVPVPKDLTTKVLQKKYLGIESDIIKQQRVRNKNNDFSTEISYAKRTEKKEIEEIMDDVRENDQCLFFVGVRLSVQSR